MYCHEGPWHLLNRIWTIDIATGDTTLLHKRSMNMEIAGHEFFSPDGNTIWYDLQKPRGETFILAGRNLETNEVVTYALRRDEWSIHFNISPDQKLFAGDGGDSTQVAHAINGRWIYLFTPSEDSLISRKLVNMQHHGYRPLEPNVHFSPDGKYVIFRSDLDGEINIYAVELK
jgi:oligogalacturonide lyase